MNEYGLKKELDQFCGTTQYHRSTFGTLNVTDGVHYLREKANCYWLIDIVESYNMTDRRVKEAEFQIWGLDVREDRSALIECREYDGKDPLASQEIEYTDFPLDGIKLYCIDRVVLLPGEY